VFIAHVASSEGDTASFSSTATGDISIVDARVVDDPAGGMIVLPPGFNISPSIIGPNQTVVEQSGSGALVFSGTGAISGTGASTVVSMSSNLSGTAVPAGVADGAETVFGGIQFINNFELAVIVTVRFDYSHWASASVTNPLLETVSDVFFDVEFLETSGGDINSPCTAGFLVDSQFFGLVAPPDDITPANADFIEQSVTIPPGSTCAYNALIQTGGKAMAIAPPPKQENIPTLGTWGIIVLVLGLFLVGVRQVLYR